MNHNGYHPQGMMGYGADPNGYAAPQYTTPQVSYSQNADQGYPAQDAPYTTPGAFSPQGSFGAPAQQNGYGLYPQQGGTGSCIPQTPYSPGYTSPDYQPMQNAYAPQGGTGSFIPQTPYSPGYVSPDYQPPQPAYSAQNGYAQQGYQQGGYASQGGYRQGGYPSLNGYMQSGNPQGGYQQSGYQPAGNVPGYNPYGQMGRMPQQGQMPGESIPLNGGGYVPKQGPVRKRGSILKDWHLILAGVLLIVLFITVWILGKGPSKTVLGILLILLAAGSAAVLWVRPLTDENKRLTYSVIALVLCILTIVSLFLTNTQNTSPKNQNDKTQNTETSQDGDNQNSGAVLTTPATVQNGQIFSEPTAEPQSAETGRMLERLVTFFTYWSGNRQDEMLDLCLPSWREKQDNARTRLFGLLANRTCKEINLENTTGTDADTSRKVILVAKINRNNGKNIDELFRMTILMVKENNEWYVDPQSLQTNENLETPDPNITPTPAPTEEPPVFSNTKLYYNPKGGEYYHLDQNCRNINSKFLPLGGEFEYSQINDEPYNKLKPCNVCGAPLRP